MQLDGKLIVITGAGKGIGQAMAQAFAARDAQLALLDIAEPTQTRTLCEQAGVRAVAHACDVSREDDVVAAFDRIAGEFGRLDVLINNAGILRDAMLIKVDGQQVTRMSLAQWQAVIDVNLTGVFLCGREAAARMATFGNGGVIVNISSISRNGNPGQTNYSAAKAGVASMTVVWARELARYGIRTGTIAPGCVRTEILNSMRPEMLERFLQQVPVRRCAEPAEIAQAAVFIAENDYFTGRTIELDGGMRI